MSEEQKEMQVEAAEKAAKVRIIICFTINYFIKKTIKNLLAPRVNQDAMFSSVHKRPSPAIPVF